MKELWTQRWKKALIWLCGYISFIAYALVGGYVIFKTTDKDLQKTAKLVFVISLIFTAIDAIILILSNISSVGAYMGRALSWIRLIVSIFEVGIFAAGIIVSLFSGGADKSEDSAKSENREKSLPESQQAASESAADSEQEKDASAEGEKSKE